MSEFNSDNALSPIDFFRLKIGESSSDVTKANLMRAVEALEKFIGGADLNFEDFNNSLLGEFIIQLLYRGMSPMTIWNNIMKRLATLYNKATEEGLAQPTEVFQFFHEKLNNYRAFEVINNVSKDTFNKLQTLIRTDFSSDPEKQLGKDILLFAIYNGGLTFEQIAETVKSKYTDNNRAIAEIVTRYSKPKNKYLFPLDQSRTTPKQLNKKIQTLIGNILRQVHLKLSEIPTYTARDLWCDVAINCGVSASDVASCISNHKALSPIALFANPSSLNDKEKEDLRTNITITLTENPTHWYVMQFRPRVSYAMIKDRLKDRNIQLIESYYPMEEVMHKIGRKKVFESRPVISWLLFFRDHATLLPKLYREIGDLAWGYRHSKSVNSPYATISDTEIKQYKTAIGDLGENTELYTEGALQLQPGDRLIVLGGILGGRPATFESMKREDCEGGRLICRILLDGGRFQDWIAHQDIRLLKKISDRQFEDLRQQNQFT